MKPKLKQPEPKTIAQLETELAAAKQVVKEMKTRIWHERFAASRYNGTTGGDWKPDPSLITRADAEVLRLKKDTGGITRKWLESAGVPWPPPHGWKRSLVAAAVAHYKLDTTPEPPAALTLDRKLKKWEIDGFREGIRPPIPNRFRRHESKPYRPGL